MVKVKKLKECRHPIVDRLLTDPEIGFVDVDAKVKRLFYERFMALLDEHVKRIVAEKEIAKGIICVESGQEKLPKTPTRNNKFLQVTASLEAIRNDLTGNEISGFTNEEAEGYAER
uniref:Uncharacterized protein n=1 Tax=Parascaris equorum TaxID=6256 RepID=A0A914SKE0_PAREQ